MSSPKASDGATLLIPWFQTFGFQSWEGIHFGSHTTQFVVFFFFFFASPGCWQELLSIQGLWEPGWAETPAELFSGSLLLWWWGWSVGRTGVPTRTSALDTPSSWASGRDRAWTRHRPSTPWLPRSAQGSCSLTCAHRTSQASENPGWATAVRKQRGTPNLSSEHSGGLHVRKQLVPTSHLCLWLSWALNPWPRLMLVSRSSLNKYLCNRSRLICYVTVLKKKTICASGTLSIKLGPKIQVVSHWGFKFSTHIKVI